MSFNVLGKDKLEEAKRKWSTIGNRLDTWRVKMEQCTAANFSELKQTFNSADAVTPHTVFDVGGNKWRLIALINYTNRSVLVDSVLDHAEYDKGKWKE